MVQYDQDMIKIEALMAKFALTPKNGKFNELSGNRFPLSTAAKAMLQAVEIFILAWR